MNNHHNSTISIKTALLSFLVLLKDTRSANTHRTYQNGLQAFMQCLSDHGLNPENHLIHELTEDAISWFSADLKYFSPATEQLYLMAAVRFYEYLAAERLAAPNLVRLKLLIRSRSRRPGIRLPQFPDVIIAKLLEYAINLTNIPVSDNLERLRNLRDRAFLLSLADTGLRVHEACELHRGDLDWNEGRAVIIGKGNRQAVIRFSKRSLGALKDYLSERTALDGQSGRPLATLPLFARHDKGAGKKVKPITTTTGRNIVKQRVVEANGPEALGLVTPHSLRHYFVTTVLRASGNLKLAQELARHQNITVTQRYAHLSNDELDRNYYEIFDNN
jgi:integrase/recombinase XerC